jgi:glycosyltransferase involved in cell wall biosynthesis
MYLDVMWHSPNPMARFWQHVKRIWILRRAIRHSAPDCVLSTMVSPNVLTLIAARGLHIPVIVSERIDPFLYSLSKAWIVLRLWQYRQARQVIVQSASYKEYFPPAIQQRAHAIPNPVILPCQAEAPEQEKPVSTHAPIIVAVGRLAHQKGFDLLLRAFASVVSDHPDWSLTIWGEGTERASLEALCDELGLKGRVQLPGITPNPFEKLQQADLFVLPSRFEGFPNVLAEAMACGLPAIAFDCSAGVRDIIRDGVDGVLVPPEDVQALASAMDKLMDDGQERQRLAARAPEVLERFGLEKVMGMWEQVITQATSSHR